MSQLSVIVGNTRRNLSEASAQHHSDADLKYWIGRAFSKYALMMMDAGEGYFETSENIGFTADNPLVDLTTLSNTLLYISLIERNTSYGTWPLLNRERRQSVNTNIGTGGGEGYLPDWKLRSNNLVLEPTPRQTEAASSTTGLKIDYVYMPTIPDANSADSFEFDANFPAIWEPMVVLDATIGALEAKDAMGGVSDINTFRAERARYEELFLNSLQRSEGPEQVEYVGQTYGNPYF